MHKIDPDENARGEAMPREGLAGDEMGRRDATAADRTMDPDALDTPGRVAPDDLSAIPSDTQPVADDEDARTVRPGAAPPNQASDQSAAPIPDVMGPRGAANPDVMGAPVPETDETLGDRHEGEEPV